MPLSQPHVVRLPRADGEPDFVLLQVTSSESRHALDLNITGTESETVFSGSVKHKNVASLRDKKSKLSAEQWENVLSSVLLGSEPDPEVEEGLEAVARVEGEAPGILSITFQKRVEGITQKYGAIKIPGLPEGEGEADIFSWCSTALLEREALKNSLKQTKTKDQEKDEQIKKLQTSLDELVKLKSENETQLLEKFSLLLNEKKLKIRDQQRLLQASTVDPAKAEALKESRTTAKSRTPGKSRGAKRKAGDAAAEESVSEDGFEAMDVDEDVNAADNSDREQTQTPEGSTADEDDEDEEPSLPIRKAAQQANQALKNGGSSQASGSGKKILDEEEEDEPPKRELPFAKKAATPLAAKPPVNDEGSETESDDEL